MVNILLQNWDILVGLALLAAAIYFRKWLLLVSIILTIAAFRADKRLPLPHAISWVPYGFGWAMLIVSILQSSNSLMLFIASKYGWKSIVERVDRVNLYRQRNTFFYRLICALFLTCILMGASWNKWWSMVPHSSDRDPTAFLGVYIFVIVAQVLGVILTIVLFKEIKAERIETPIDLFKVFHNAVVEANVKGSAPVVIHHIAPFPGLFEML